MCSSDLWLYWAYGTGNIFLPDASAEFAQYYVPWSEGMGPNLQDGASGIFWAAFTLFAATTASIVSGSVIERIRMGAWIILAVLVGSVVWIIAAGWGWSTGGWLVVDWGYHDVGAAGVVHMISGFFALGVLINLGPRVGRFNADGSANQVLGTNGSGVLSFRDPTAINIDGGVADSDYTSVPTIDGGTA